MGRGSSGLGNSRVSASSNVALPGITRTRKEDGVFTSFDSKQSFLDWASNYGVAEWESRFETPKGFVTVIPDGAINQTNLKARMTEAGIYHSELLGYTQRNVGGTGMNLGPIMVKLNNAKTKRKIKTDKRGLKKVTLKE